MPVSDGPGDYADNAQCTWLVTAAGPIAVVFKAFATEQGIDFVTLFDGTRGEVRYSGVAVPPPFSTNSTSLTILFTSDSSKGSSGFELEVFALMPGGTWAPTAAPATAVPTTAVPTTAAPTNSPTNAPTNGPVPTLAPDIPGMPSAHSRRERARSQAKAHCAHLRARSRGCLRDALDAQPVYLCARKDVIASFLKQTRASRRSMMRRQRHQVRS